VSDAARASAAGLLPGRVLVALIVGQLGLHASMAGLRMSAPLMALRDGRSEWSVGVLMSLFAVAPVLLAMHAGRMADRHGYHRPVRAAVGVTLIGMCVAMLATWADGWLQFALLCVAATFTGAGTNLGLIAIQRTAGHWATDSVQRMRIFSWLGLAPSLSNVVGPVLAGFVIDAANFRAAFAVMLCLPLLSWFYARRVPRSAPAPHAAPQDGTAWDLLSLPGLKRLMLVNLLLSACWDVHTFAVPVLGHERGFSASTIGLVLGSFTLAVTAVRLAIPAVAHQRGVCCLSVRHQPLADGAARDVARPRTRQRPADDHVGAAPSHAAATPRRGDRAALDRHQPVEQRAATGVRRGRSGGGHRHAVLERGRCHGGRQLARAPTQNLMPAGDGGAGGGAAGSGGGAAGRCGSGAASA
jgi:MFS family permease